MSKYFLLLACFIVPIIGFSQPAGYQPLSQSEQNVYMQSIKKASRELTSLQTDFVQEKQSVIFSEIVKSTGKMYYQSPSSLRWEYKTPSQMILAGNAQNIILKNEQGSTMAPKMVKDLVKMMLNMINGQSLADTVNFSAKYYQGTHILVQLSPKSKRMKDMYKSVEVYIGKKDFLAEKVVLYEANGDITTIRFSNKTMNLVLKKDLFQ